MVSVLVMRADTAYHCVKIILTAHVGKNALTAVADLCAQLGINALRDKYVYKAHACLVVTVTEIVEMTCCARQNFA